MENGNNSTGAGSAGAAPAPGNEPTIVPTPGRIVLYSLSAYDVVAIHEQRGHNHSSNEVNEGQVLPAIVVAVWGTTPRSAVNLKVMLDGADTFWATSRSVGDKPGTYHWMGYQLGQAAKHAASDAAEAKPAQAS